jgi:hypothetical protein
LVFISDIVYPKSFMFYMNIFETFSCTNSSLSWRSCRRLRRVVLNSKTPVSTMTCAALGTQFPFPKFYVIFVSAIPKLSSLPLISHTFRILHQIRLSCTIPQPGLNQPAIAAAPYIAQPIAASSSSLTLETRDRDAERSRSRSPRPVHSVPASPYRKDSIIG